MATSFLKASKTPHLITFLIPILSVVKKEAAFEKAASHFKLFILEINKELIIVFLTDFDFFSSQ